MYWASPRTPCSGPNSAASLSPRAPWRRSAAWTSARVTAVGLHTRPTRFPASGRKRRSARTSSPGTTRASAAAVREREREAARLFLRVRGIAQVPVGAGPDVGILEGVLEDLDRGRLARGRYGDADLEVPGEVGQLGGARPVGAIDERLDRLLELADVGARDAVEVEPPLEHAEVGPGGVAARAQPLDGLLQLAALKVDAPEAGVGGRVARVARKRAAQRLLRALQVLRLQADI